MRKAALWISSWILSLCPLMTMGQGALRPLTPDDLLFMLLSNHPVAQQAGLFSDQAEANLRMVRGSFDPKLLANWDGKVFEDKTYYNLFDGGLKVVTPIALEVKAGYETNEGIFLNPEHELPVSGQSYLGIELPLLQNLLIDERRAAVRQAKIFTNLAANEQIAVLNDLCFDALISYWNWAVAHNLLKVLDSAVTTSQIRFDAVKQGHRFGDNPAVDTLEAFIQLQTRQLAYQEAEIELIKSRLELSNFLWTENGLPLEVTDSLPPLSIENLDLANYPAPDSLLLDLAAVVNVHPDLRAYDFKLQQLAVDERLNKNMLLPQLNVGYSLLQAGVPFTDNAGSIDFDSNYKWGVSFDFPLFLRKERGKLGMTRLKLRETELQRSQKALELRNKILSFRQQLSNLRRQTDLYASAVQNYAALLAAEERKFEAGESSLFLINSREIKLIESQAKLLELKAKYFNTQAGIFWAAGILYQPSTVEE